MSESGYYPPPDFSSPPPSTFQQQPRASSFQPGMWHWQETPSETSWGYNTSYYGATASYGSQSLWGSYATNAAHGVYTLNPTNAMQQKHCCCSVKNKKEPEFPYFCDTCDRAFKNTEKYNEHMSQHVKCSVPDCTFMAHEKIVNIHWKNTHAPGTKRIKLDTPEEIAKWREERRKNYPTRENVEKKKKMMEMREKPGAVLETAQFGGRGRGRGRGRGWGNRGSQGGWQGAFHASNGNVPEKSQTPPQVNRDGDPLGALVRGEHDSDNDDAVPEKVVVAPKQISSALGSLMANYGSMSESEEEPDSAPIQKAQALIQENQTIRNSIPTHSQNFTPVTFNAERYDDGRGRGRRGRGRRGKGRHHDTPKKMGPTLLEMLLAPDIRHERNVLLQCVRYIVRNNFFGLENKSQEGNQKSSSVTNGKRCDGGENHVHTDVDQCSTADSAPEERSAGLVENSPVKSFSHNAAEVMDCQNENKSSYQIYDDEIWESDLK
ncbi:hypothetical protein NQD34_001041 [Periophthalmus magnuspinnatus]|nr:hypothetical protein NQD34_001041 [Periophthalmus magnuspinnatus]